MTKTTSYYENIKATPEQVWAVIADITRLPEWSYSEGRYPYPVKTRYGGEQKEGVGMIWVGISGDEQTATYKVTKWEQNKRLAYELQEAENAPLQMTQTNTLTLEAEGDDTKIDWTVDWELTGGFSLSSLLIKMTGNSSFEEMIAGSLENLKALVESETSK